MANKIQIDKVADIVENAPLSEILSTIEAVAMFVPGIGNVAQVICKVLRILIKVQPSASGLAHGFAKMQQNENIKTYASFIPTDNTAELNVLRTMVDIALEDGELTDDEMSMLINKAEANGINADIFKMGIKNVLKSKNK